MVHNSVKNHLKDAVHSFKYFAANCTEVAHLGSEMNSILLMMTMVENVLMIANVIIILLDSSSPDIIDTV